MRLTILFLLVSVLLPSTSRAQAPVFEFMKGESAVTFNVKASVAIEGKFDKWDATVTFRSPELSTAVLDNKIQALCRYGKRHKEWQAEKQGFLRCRAQSADYVSLNQG